MIATLWNHWFVYYVDFRDDDGNFLSQDWFNDFDMAYDWANRMADKVILDDDLKGWKVSDEI